MESLVTLTPQGMRSEHEDYHEHEATEMDQYEGVSRCDELLSPLPEGARATATEAHERYFHTLRNSIKTFWKRQIRATVAHEACRDHFGTHGFFSSKARFKAVISASLAMSPLTLSGIAHMLSTSIYRRGSWRRLTYFVFV